MTVLRCRRSHLPGELDEIAHENAVPEYEDRSQCRRTPAKASASMPRTSSRTPCARRRRKARRRCRRCSASPTAWNDYAVDFAQRAILFWDTHAPARQQLPRAPEEGAAAAAALRLRNRARRAQVRAPGQLRAGAHRAARGRHGRPEAPALRRSSTRAPATARASAASRTTRRSASRCATGTRSTSSSSSPSRSPARRCSTSARPKPHFVHKVRELHPESPKPVDRRQLPGRLGGDDAGRFRPRRHRADRHQRRADVLLGRRLGGGRRRQPDALRGRPARRHLAVVAGRRPGQRRLRRRLPGPELREPAIRPTPSGTSTTTCSRTSTPSRRASSNSSAGGAASTC